MPDGSGQVLINIFNYFPISLSLLRVSLNSFSKAEGFFIGGLEKEDDGGKILLGIGLSIGLEGGNPGPGRDDGGEDPPFNLNSHSFNLSLKIIPMITNKIKIAKIQIQMLLVVGGIVDFLIQHKSAEFVQA